MKFRDIPLSNFDLIDWCKYLKIPIKGIFSRNESKPYDHSPCIINLDDLGKAGTHWVCCRHSKKGEYEYFDSFGLPPPLEWETELIKKGLKSFLRNDVQIQCEKSLRCGYYCLLFLNERNRGTSYQNILDMFSDDLHENERVVKKYFPQ